MYFVYVLQSTLKRKFYIGYTENLERRMVEHQNKHSVFDRTYGPFNLVLVEEHQTKLEAMKREKEIKSYKGGNSFRDLLAGAPR